MMRGVTGVHKIGVPAEWLERVAVFPLPRAVFFPGTSLPLHLFEPRYRQMMADCLEQGRMVMAVTQLRPGYEPQYHARPAIYELCGLGRIEHHEALPDGRFNLVLKGVCRVRLEEMPDAQLPYRQAHATLLEDRDAGEVRREAVQALIATAAQVASMIRKRYPNFEMGISEDDPPSQIADTLADRLIGDPETRQTLLEELSVPERIARLTDQVAGLWAQLSHSAGASKSTLH